MKYIWSASECKIKPAGLAVVLPLFRIGGKKPPF